MWQLYLRYVYDKGGGTVASHANVRGDSSRIPFVGEDCVTGQKNVCVKGQCHWDGILLYRFSLKNIVQSPLMASSDWSPKINLWADPEKHQPYKYVQLLNNFWLS